MCVLTFVFVYQVKDGHVSVDVLKTFATQKYGNDEKTINQFVEIGQECSSITDPNRCELSTKLAQCILNGATKRGIDPKKGN